MIRYLSVFLLLTILASNYSLSQNSKSKRDVHLYKVHYDPVDSLMIKNINLWLEMGRQNVIAFFGKDYQKQFDVYLFSNRDSLDKQWQKDWNMPEFKSQCWMVASGIAHRLDILSPRTWEFQACEHDAADTSATRKIIFHEMIHVFHGQLNPSPAFENTDNIDWFIEGIAVYASGQLDEERYKNARNFMITNEGPKQLSDIWKGNNKYGFAGSMVKYIDDNYGRSALVNLLSFASADEILDYLKISEEQLVLKWKNSVKSNEALRNK